MPVLVTGAAGFIGFSLCRALLARGEAVIGVDDLNDYYDPALKEARLHRLRESPSFVFERLDIAQRDAMLDLARRHPTIDRVVNLAAQAGVRYSLVNPHAYTRSNVEGFLVVLELCRALSRLTHLVYASSSSVYGGNTKLPFAVEDRVDTPISLYAATKRANELMAHCYSHLHRLPTTGLRYFTVYGPWGRPDMSAYIFTKAILENRPIPVFNQGDMRRDFTYIDDIVAGTLAVLDRPPADPGTSPPYRLYNIGNHRSEPLMRFIGLIEEALGKKAVIDFQPMQPGDVRETYADIAALSRDTGYRPATAIDEGIPRFIEWYRAYHRL
ncbi:MAG: NAD-dependent epimerase/dehydratase family protein [Rhodospirillales bacterium]|nr:NAD-dependent epimerase/dehydratase family protein [Rhodospirillales bacterium]